MYSDRLDDQILKPPDQPVKMAGFLIRFFCFWIDFIVIMILYMSLSSTIFRFFRNATVDIFDSGMGIFGIFFGVFGLHFTAIFYHAIMESTKYQGSLGKMLVGIKVTNYSGAGLSLGRALARNFSKLLSFWTLYIGFLMCFWTEKEQTLHDIIAKSLVIKIKK
jgi:uncharacterized RDD family membrane protein YckC